MRSGHPIDARFELPGSKSYSNRALACAAFAGAPITVRNLSPADDTALMLNVLVDLGWTASRGNPLSPDVQLEPPTRPRAFPHPQTIYAGPAGTVARFAAALLAVTPGDFILDGNERMRRRPMAELVDALRQLGAKIAERGEPGCLPLAIEGASLRGGACRVRGDVSSQFVSALLMAGPTRAAGVEIEVEGELASKSYVDMTIEVMRAFGVAVERDGYRRFRVPPAGVPSRRGPYVCPPDATAAGYFWAAAAVTGGRCVIDGLSRDDVQGDVRLAGIFEQMGCRVLEFPNGLGVEGRASEAVSADLSDLPDSAQTLAVVCAFARGTSRLGGLGTLRGKETDRIAALQSELAKLGVITRAGADWLEVDGNPDANPGAVISTHDDHRMAMSFAVAGLRVPLTIENPEVVSKSFPAFWEYWERLTPGV
jgi:3-phosphoshikimate 1-carboxyvinyltransferase